MSKYKHSEVSEFRLEGRFLGFLVEDGYKIKYMRLATAEGECCIKLTKTLRASISQVLVPGDWVAVSGEKIVDWEKGRIKLKAYQLIPAVPSQPQSVTPAKAQPTKQQACILVCQKSDCCQRGAMEVCKALQGALRDRSLEDQVTIRKTGCMKQCKTGPHIVVMPDKTAYQRVNPAEIPDLIEKHFGTVTNSGEPVPEPSLVG